jgi:thymidylate synthase
MATYEQALAHVLEHGQQVRNRTGTDTVSVFAPEVQISHDLAQGFPLLTTKAVPFEKVARELAWFLSGSTTVKDLHPVKIWDAWANPETGECGPIYGHTWKRFGGSHPVSHGPGQFDPGVDQIANLVRDITTCALDEGASVGRRLILSAWDPRALPFQALPPCHLLTQFSVRDKRLSCAMTMRSADLFLGVPWNLASYALLTHLLVHTVNEALTTEQALSVGRIVIRFGDAHIYVNHLDQVRAQLARKHRPFPRLVLCDDTNVYLFKDEDAMVVGYDPHPALPAPVAV